MASLRERGCAPLAQSTVQPRCTGRQCVSLYGTRRSIDSVASKRGGVPVETISAVGNGHHRSQSVQSIQCARVRTVMKNIAAAAARERDQADSSLSKQHRFGRHMVVAACGLAAATGFVIGAVASTSQAHRFSFARGACVGLEFAEHFGALSATQKRQAMRAITASTSTSPHQSLFALTAADFEDLCARTWAGDTRSGR